MASRREAVHPSGVARLSKREREVWRLVAQGLPSKQIARALGISERTVTFHTTVRRRWALGDRPGDQVGGAGEGDRR